jgi:hypothetical protein
LAGGTGYDGQIMFNPYSKTPILIKNGIWDKYVDTNGPCGIVGVPKELEGKAGVPNDSRAINNKSWYQMFEKGTYTNNAIYAYNWKNNKWNIFEPEKYAAHFTVRKVANAYHESGGTWSNHKFPTGDTFGGDQAAYCRQWFEGNTDNPFDVCDQGVGIEEEFIVNTGDGQTRGGFIKIHHSPIDDVSQSYPGGDQKVWLISHGMKNNYTHMIELADSIKEKEPGAIILLLDWEGARRANLHTTISPTNTDQWIRPTAEEVGIKLREWGFDNGNNLRMAGHSMGTIMINEIAKEISYGDVAGLYFLDPPNFLPTTDKFVVDERPGSTNAIYDKDRGYNYHYPRAQVSKAFTGIKRDGNQNWCGNADLNRTAKEHVSLYFNDYKEKWPPPLEECSIHGLVTKSFGSMIDDQKLVVDQTSYPNIYAKDFGNFKTGSFYGVDNGFNASINVKGENSIQTIMKYNQNDEIEMWSKYGGVEYQDFNSNLYGVSARKKIVVKSFGDGYGGQNDRISLERTPGALQHGDYASTYRVEGNKIYREVVRFETSLVGFETVTIAPEYLAMEVKGDRSGEDFDTLYNNAILNPIDDNPIFTLR